MKQNTTTRRRFFWKAGAALSAPLAIVAATESAADVAAGDAAERLARLEDVNAIRELNAAYARHLNACAHHEIARLFANPAEGCPNQSLHAVSADRFGPQERIEISPDRTTATARIPCTVQIDTPIEPSCTLVEMARAQGGGVIRRAEAGFLESSYVKRDGAWKIERISFRPS